MSKDRVNKGAAAPKSNPKSDAHSISRFCRELGVGRTTFYKKILKENPPLSAAIGGRRMIVESPSEYLRRVAELQSRQAVAA